jgi:CRP-like cAMP-binding protein
MPEILKTHIARFISLKGEDSSQVLSFFQSIHLKKKQNILSEGQVCKQHYFVEKGLLRMFYINDKGVEHTIQFALENWWLTDLMSYQDRRPSGFYIQAVEATELMAINLEDQEKLLEQYPVMEKYFRIIFQKAYAANQLRIKYIHDLSSAEMYDRFAGQNPAFVQRVPQYLLASFLGFTPEYLSELRRKKLS